MTDRTPTDATTPAGPGPGDERAFYAHPGPLTALDALERDRPELFADLPSDPTGIVAVVRGLILHPFMEALYQIKMPPEHRDDVQIRGAEAMIERMLVDDGRPLVERRELTDHFFGNCRHFSTLTVALLRRAGVPSRARCGFGGYFDPIRWVDHWVVEHWDGDRWVMLDAQIDDTQRRAFAIDFDPADLSPGRFLTGGDAWQRCQAGTEDGDHFGIMDMWGQWFIPGNVLRDLAALNKVEMLPWDAWGDFIPEGRDDHSYDEARIDDLAALTQSGDHAAITRRYQADDGVRVPARVWALFTPDGPELVDVPELGGAS
jgi:hypothetical protein